MMPQKEAKNYHKLSQADYQNRYFDDRSDEKEQEIYWTVEIKNYLKTNNYWMLQKLAQKLSLITLKNIFNNLKINQQVQILRYLDNEINSEFFATLELGQQNYLLDYLTQDLKFEIANNLMSSEIKKLICHWNSQEQEEFLSLIKDQKRNSEIRYLLTFDDNQIGSFMSPDFGTLNENSTLAQALKTISQDWEENSLLTHYFFVSDDRGIFKGATRLEDIAFNQAELKIKEIMFSLEAIKTDDDAQKAINLFAKQDLSVLPVINHNQELAGIITTDQVIDIINEEATEDFYKAAGIQKKDTTAYTQTPVQKLVKSRLFWLVFLLIGSTISQIIIQSFTTLADKNIQTFINVLLLTTLVPVISGAAGNAGSQSSSTIIRAAALGEFENYPFKKIIFREISVAFFIGLILFVINTLRLLIYYALDGSLASAKSANVYILILGSSFSLWLVIIWAKLIGALIPLLAIKLKKDPTVLSTPLLTTLTDGIATAIFYSVTILLFIYLGVA